MLKEKTTTTIIKRRKAEKNYLTDEFIDSAETDCSSILWLNQKMGEKILKDRNFTPNDLPDQQATNRKLRSKKNKKVDLLIKDMQQGNWHPTTIIFSRDGLLRDGQHRISAAIQSGVDVQFNVHVGAKASIMSKLDRHKARSASEWLGLDYFQNKGLKPSYWSMAEKIATRGMSFFESKRKTKTEIQTHNPTDSEVAGYCDKKLEAIKWCSSLSANKKPKGFSRYAWRVALAEMYHKSPEKALLLLHSLGSATKASCPSRQIVKIMAEQSKERDLDHRDFFIDQLQRFFYCMDRFLNDKGIRGVVGKKNNL